MIVECPGCHNRYDVTGRPAGTRARCRCGTVFTLPEPSHSAAYLRCPQCDAAVSPDTTACSYCEAALAVKACPRCFGRMFVGSKHCRLCGAPVDVPAAADPEGNATPRLCPRCRHTGDVRLEGRLVDSFLLDECDRCHGVYVDADTLQRILDERRRASTTDAMGFARGATAEMPAQPGGPMYVKCPDCDTLMTRRNFGRSSGVIVDVCAHHGTWFDAEELSRVVAFVRDGGLERAARRQIERDKEDARRMRSRARAEAMRARRRSGLLGSDLRSRAAGGLALGAFVGAIGSILNE